MTSPTLKVSLNVSPRQLSQADFTEAAELAILDSGARARTCASRSPRGRCCGTQPPRGHRSGSSSTSG